MTYVITCGDEGVQINEGTRLSFIGAGVQLEGFSKVVAILKKILKDDKDNIAIAASEQNDWIKDQFTLDNWEQASATMQQQVEALADKEGLKYAGLLPFADPRQLKNGVKGHMVRPKGIHIANKIGFTLAGGEQTYNLGRYLISADWVAKADTALIKKVIQPQIDFYTKLAKQDLPFHFEMEGPLGEEVAEANKKALAKAGFGD
jgi:hypothetical protein